MNETTPSPNEPPKVYLSLDEWKNEDFEATTENLKRQRGLAILGKTEDERQDARSAILIAYETGLLEDLRQMVPEKSNPAQINASNMAGLTITWAEKQGIIPTEETE